MTKPYFLPKMKQIAIYAAGTLMMMVAAFLILSGHPAYIIAGFLLSATLYKSGSTKYGRKFWRTWHRVNFSIIKYYESI